MREENVPPGFLAHVDQVIQTLIERGLVEVNPENQKVRPTADGLLMVVMRLLDILEANDIPMRRDDSAEATLDVIWDVLGWEADPDIFDVAREFEPDQD